MTENEFSDIFYALTDHRPFPWQWALYQRFAEGDFPTSCNLPTGLGKTMVIAIWLIALAFNPRRIPRRLVYVVNRRTVVDQTTDEVVKLRDNLRENPRAAKLSEKLAELCAMPLEEEQPPLAISTLRGQFADNREWSADPARPAVIAGTVDMIGSRLLFSGYGIGFKSRPLHAGFLGQDVLLVHDEAHLEPAFQQLLTDIENEQERGERTGTFPWPKLRVLELTATKRDIVSKIENNNKPKDERLFELTDQEQHPPERISECTDDEPPIHCVWRRMKARKHLSLTAAEDDKQVPGKIAAIAANYKDANTAVLVFARTLDAVSTIEKELHNTKRKVVSLTGTMRGKERDELVERPEFNRFVKGAKPDETVYLVCTSAGEVGIDISAEHMVCDLSTFESMAQRLGRVHRYGEPIAHSARIDVVHPASFGKKADDIDKRRSRTLELLRQLPSLGDDLHDASPKAIRDLQDRFTPQQLELPVLAVGDGEYQRLKAELANRRITSAYALEPGILRASDILFDAWALTTMRERLPGRPEVAPYLHGIADDLPQTTIAWRAELDILKDDPAPRAKLRAIFSKHRIRPHESLTVRSYQVVRFLKEITAANVRPDLLDARVALILVRNLELTSVKALIDDPGPLNADPTLVLPASFGGLDDKGMLSVPKSDNKISNRHVPEATAARVVPTPSLDVADSDGYEPRKDAKPRVRILIERSEDGWSTAAMPGGSALPAELEASHEKSTQLIQHVQTRSGLNVRLVRAIEFDDDGAPVRSLVCLSPPRQQRNPAVAQTLQEHVSQVEKEAARLADTLLLGDKVANAAMRFAAKWHDEGKKARRWQRYIGGPDANNQPLGKAAEWRDPGLLAGYRHEFGSLLRIPNQEVRGLFSECLADLTADQQKGAYDLALHLIAAHHGYARPHFDNPWDPESTDSQCETAHVESIQRYARTQRKYGRWGLAYLESVLRAADAAASSIVGVDPETDDDDTIDSEGGDA